MSRGAEDNSTFKKRVEKRRAKRRAAGRSERGAALVEAAIIFLPLCLIVFGIIEYGFIFKNSLTISSATRAGARTASAEPKADTFYDDVIAAVTVEATGLELKGGEELFIYRANVNGLPQSGNIDVCSAACEGYTWNAGSKKFVRASGPNRGAGWNPSTHKACLGATSSDSVGIKLRIQHDALSGFFRDLKLQEKTVMRFEPLTTDCA